jgi:hypothetical protein
VDARELTCVVIGPIGDRDAAVGTSERKSYEDAISVLENIVEPACAAYQMAVTRADRIAKPGEIPDQVFRLLRDAFLVVADLTEGNPNVMYELGLRHTTGKLTIQIGERGKLPFDVSVIRTILFKRSEGGFIEAQRKLSAAIGAGLEGGADPVTATRIWFEAATPLLSPQQSGEVDDDDDEPGYLEKLADLSSGLDAGSVSLDVITSIFREINGIVKEATEKIVAVNAAGGDAQARLVLANTLADRLADPAARYQVGVGEYCSSIIRMDPGIRYILSNQTSDNSESLQSFRERLREMIAAVEPMFESATQYVAVAEVTAGASRSLKRVYRGIIKSMNQLLQTRAVFDGWKSLLEGGA